MSRGPVEEAIEVFLDVKRKVVRKDEDLGSKLRTRSHEMPEIMLELGLVPALSFCLAKAKVETLKLVVSKVEDCELSLRKEGGKEPSKEELSYAAYAYVTLRYLCKQAPAVGAGSVCDLVREENKLYEFLLSMMEGAVEPPVYGLLQQYLQQFKRLCGAAFKPERGR